MSGNETTDGGEQDSTDESSATKAYRKLCKAMEPGLLITVNCSTTVAPTGVDEMEVLSVEENGDLRLKAHSGEIFLLYHDDDQHGTAIKEMSETEFSPVYDPVISIEVIGVAE